jgi:tetratricopeptide (TPR) repeat protein
MIAKLKNWWNEDTLRGGLIVGCLAYALFFTQGIPFWDDDFTSWFWKIKDQSLFHYILEWISPISTQPQYWGFNERPLQCIIYKLCYMIAGYEAWPYLLFKCAVYAGLGGMIYAWSRRLVPSTKLGARAAAAAAIFFIVAPGPMAAHILYQDFAPVAELLFLALTYVIWSEIEKTPESWTGIPDLSDPAQKSWVLRWSGIAFCTYLAYKSKADLKLVPGILALYVLSQPARRKQWKFFVVPVGLMGLLAVPWGPGVFSKLPPFLPGSKGSEIGWMWQPASMERLTDFIWQQGSYNFLASLHSPTIALSGLLGPFLLVGMIAFLVWRMEAFDKVQWRTQATSVDRARTFALVWFLVIMAGTSALSPINYTFRIRYGIMPMVPVSLLLAWVFGLFATAMHNQSKQLPKWAVAAGIALLAIQAGINLNRSIDYRRSMGQVIVSVDQVYEAFNTKYADKKLALLPDFRPYDYRPDASQAIKDKVWLSKNEDLKPEQAGKTYVISWNPSLWDQYEMVGVYSGCRSGNLFDAIFPCPAGTGAVLMKFIGSDPLFAQGEMLRQKGDIAGARKLHEQYLAKYPESLGGMFVAGLEQFQLKDWEASERTYSHLEKYVPNHLGVLYNHALALAELKQYKPSIERLKYVINQDPKNYAALINLYYTYVKAGESGHAKGALMAMKLNFPQDAEVNRLLAGS